MSGPSEVSAVAKVSIARQWTEDDALQVTIEADTAYPDALAEAKRIALDTFAEALGVTLKQEAPDE